MVLNQTCADKAPSPWGIDRYTLLPHQIRPTTGRVGHGLTCQKMAMKTPVPWSKPECKILVQWSESRGKKSYNRLSVVRITTDTVIPCLKRATFSKMQKHIMRAMSVFSNLTVQIHTLDRSRPTVTVARSRVKRTKVRNTSTHMRTASRASLPHSLCDLHCI